MGLIGGSVQSCVCARVRVCVTEGSYQNPSIFTTKPPNLYDPPVLYVIPVCPTDDALSRSDTKNVFARTHNHSFGLGPADAHKNARARAPFRPKHFAGLLKQSHATDDDDDDNGGQRQRQTTTEMVYFILSFLCVCGHHTMLGCGV